VVPGLLERSRGKFLENGQRELAELRQLVADGAYPQAASVAHKLKGASLTIGATRLGAQLQQIEVAADQRQDAVVQLLDDLDQCFDNVREALLTTQAV
jgi:HPt (histidine-containing phosphotransfer) domain-containing protein